MKLSKVTQKDISVVQRIVYKTVEAIYPKYYPTEVVTFFLNHHSEENILADIEEGGVYLLTVDGEPVATGTMKDEFMNRVFVLPEFQGRGYGKVVMDFLEGEIARKHTAVYLDSSLPAFYLYLKRGYVSVEYMEELVGETGVICYHVMKKTIVKEPTFPQPITAFPEADIPIQGIKAYLSQASNHQIIFMEFAEDVELLEHTHESQWGIVLEGRIDLTIGGVKGTYTKGDRYFIPKDTPHFGHIYAGYADMTFFNQAGRYNEKK